MSPKIRALIIAIFILVFFILSPLIIFYGYGYRYDFRYRRFTKTGNLLVTSSPTNALVLLNGKSRKMSWYESLLIYKRLPWAIKMGGRTPVNLAGLLPGQHEATISKEGYQIWKRQIEILAEKTVNLQNIKLFLQEPKIEQRLEIYGAEKVFLSPNKTNIIYQKNNKAETYYLYLPNNREQKIEGLQDEILAIEWGWQEKSALIKTKNEYKIISLEGVNVQSQIKLKRQKFDLLQWSLNNPHLLYGQKGFLIYRFNLKEQREELLFNFSKFTQKQPKNWLVNEPDIYWTTETGASATLSYASIIKDGEKGIVQMLIKDINLHFALCAEKQLICLEGERSLWLIKKRSFPSNLELFFQYPAKNIIWQTNNRFLIHNDYEILMGWQERDTNNKEIMKYEIVLRTSDKILKTDWYPSGDWIIYQTQDGLYALELNDEKPNLIKIISIKNLKDFWLDNIRTVYLLKKSDSIWQILKMKIN